MFCEPTFDLLQVLITLLRPVKDGVLAKKCVHRFRQSRIVFEKLAIVAVKPEDLLKLILVAGCFYHHQVFYTVFVDRHSFPVDRESDKCDLTSHDFALGRGELEIGFPQSLKNQSELVQVTSNISAPNHQIVEEVYESFRWNT